MPRGNPTREAVVARVFWKSSGQQLVCEAYSAMLDKWAIPHEQLTLPTREGDTFVIAAGSKQSPAIVLLHGGMATSAMWLRDIGVWAKEFRVIAVDIIGDAGFSAPSRPSMKSDAHAAWLTDVFDVLEISQSYLVGASLGGWIALDVAIRRPDAVKGLFLLAPAGIGRFRPAFILKAAPLLFLGPWGHRKALNFDMGFETVDTSDADITFPALFKLVAANFVARVKPIPMFSDSMLASIRVPVMIMVGEDDEAIDSSHTLARVSKLMPTTKVRSVAGVGHGVQVPTEAVATFFRENARGNLGAA